MAESLKSEPLRAVQIDSLAVMKMVKHCSQAFPTTATGFLVGMDAKGILEATNAFPFPTSDVPNFDSHHDGAMSNLAAAAPRAKANAVYQNEMIRNLREVNVDANNVGWYTSANMGNFVTTNLIENQYHYQKEMNERTVALVHDVSRSSQGALSLRAFRLSPAFMIAYRDSKFTTESLQQSGLKFQDILVELPLQVHSSHVLTTFLHQLPTPPADEQKPMPASVAELDRQYRSSASTGSQPLAPNLDALDLSIDPFLEKTCDLLLDGIESHSSELNNHQYYQRQLAREQNKITAWQTKRKAENATRAATKQPLLPEDEWQRLFKLPTEPSRLELLLNSRQVEQYARQVDAFTATVSGKMFAVRGNLMPGEGKES